MKKRRITAIVLAITLVLQLMGASNFQASPVMAESLTTEIIAFGDSVKDVTINIGDEEPNLARNVEVEVLENGNAATKTVEVDWVLPEGEKFSSKEEAQFIYTGELVDENYTVAAGVEMPKVTVSVKKEGTEENVKKSVPAPISNTTPVTFETKTGKIWVDGEDGTFEGVTMTFINEVYANGQPIVIEASESEGNSKIFVDTDGSGTLTGSETYIKTTIVDGEEATDDLNLENATIYGGSEDEALETNTSITMTGGHVQYIYGGSKETSLTGDTSVSFKGGLVETIYGGGVSDIYGNTKVNMTGGTVVDAVFGGGNEDVVSRNTSVNITGGHVGYFKTSPEGFYEDYRASVFGGGYSGAVRGTTNVTIGGNVIIGNSVFGGSIEGGEVVSTNVEVNNGTIGILSEAQPLRAFDAKEFAGFSNFDSDGMCSTMGNVFGGGIAYSDILGDTNVIINGGRIGTDTGDQSVDVAVVGNVFGGSYSGDVYGTANVTINGGDIGDITVNFEKDSNNNDDAPEYYDKAAGYIGNVYGGGLQTADWGEANVSFTKVTINDGANIEKATGKNVINLLSGNVYGSGLGMSGNWPAMKVMSENASNQTTAVYHLGGTVTGNLYSSGSPYFYGDYRDRGDTASWTSNAQPYISESTFIFLNDSADLKGNLYKSEYTGYGNSHPGHFETTAVIEDTQKLFIGSLAEDDEKNKYEETVEQHNVSQKVATDEIIAAGGLTDGTDGELDSINLYYDTIIGYGEGDPNILRLQEFDTYATDDGEAKAIHWAMNGDVDLSSHDVVQNNIGFTENQELYIHGNSALNATTFVKSAKENGGYIITNKADITRMDTTGDDISVASDTKNRIYRGVFDSGVGVTGGDIYSVGEKAANLTAGTTSTLGEFLGTKVGIDGDYAWSSKPNTSLTPSGTNKNTISPTTENIGTTSYKAMANFEHRFDSVYMGDEHVEANSGDAYYNIGILKTSVASGSDDVQVIATGTEIFEVEFKKEPIEGSDTIHTEKVVSGETVKEPTEDDLKDIKEPNPDYWTTTPNDPSTKWEFDKDKVEKDMVLYPYYEPGHTVIFTTEDNDENDPYKTQKVLDGENAIEPDKFADDFPSKELEEGSDTVELPFVGWYTAPEGDESAERFNFLDTPIIEDIVLYPHYLGVGEDGVTSVAVLFEDPNDGDHDDETGDEFNLAHVFLEMDGQMFPFSGELRNYFHHTEWFGFDDVITAPKDPTLEGHVFVGWYLAEFPEEPEEEAEAVSLEDEADEREIDPEDFNDMFGKYDGQDVHDFDMNFWDFVEDDTYNKYVNGENIQYIIFYPLFEEGYTVTFENEDKDTDDGKHHDKVTVEKDTAVTKPTENPTSTDPNKEFVSWYKDKDCTEEYTFGDKVREDITLYPKFEDKTSTETGKVTVTFMKESEGDSKDSNDVLEVKPDITSGSTVDETTKYDNDNDVTDGKIKEPDAWTTVPNDITTKWDFGKDKVGTENIVLYPYYEKEDSGTETIPGGGTDPEESTNPGSGGETPVPVPPTTEGGGGETPTPQPEIEDDKGTDPEEDKPEIAITPPTVEEPIDKVEINGKELDKDDYTIDENGNLVIDPEYIATLPDGEHTITIEIAGKQYETIILMSNGVPLSMGEFNLVGEDEGQTTWSLFDLLSTIFVTLSALYIAFIKKRKKNNEDEEKWDEFDRKYNETEDKKFAKLRRGKTIALAVEAVMAIILLFITQDFINMVIFDEYSVAFALSVVLSIILVMMANKKPRDDEDRTVTIADKIEEYREEQKDDERKLRNGKIAAIIVDLLLIVALILVTRSGVATLLTVDSFTIIFVLCMLLIGTIIPISNNIDEKDVEGI